MSRNSSSRIKSFFIALIALVLVSVLILLEFLLHDDDKRLNFVPIPNLQAATSLSSRWRQHSLEKRAESCKIPVLDPTTNFSLTSQARLNLTEESICKYPHLFNATAQYVIPREAEVFKKWGVRECCYQAVERGEGIAENGDNVYRNSTCEELSLANPTSIPHEKEFIAVYCTFDQSSMSIMPNETSVLVDVFYFVHLKPEVEKRLEKKDNDTERQGKLNVIVFGIDSVSRMNFIRHFRNSYKFLMEDLGAIEMKAYSVLGWITFTNLAPLLTSLSHEEVTVSCARDGYFDTCPGIWKVFSRAGYRTSWIEDWPSLAILNYYGKGFRNAPTDYYPRPLALKAEQEFRSFICQGPHLTVTKLVGYMKALVETMEREKKPFFHLSWLSGQTHEPMSLNEAYISDLPLLQGLQWLKGKNYLQNTVLIVMSDHGKRPLEFKDRTLGIQEFQLPFMYLVMPPFFKENYSLAYNNLLGNRDRLTSNFDLYETLKDITKIKTIQQDSLQERIRTLQEQEKMSMLPRGISHFLPIPSSRSCKEAGISDIYCACEHLWKIVDFSQNSTMKPLIMEGVNFALNQINSEVNEHPQCKELQLLSVGITRERVGSGNESRIFKASFYGHGLFGETTLSLTNGNETSSKWSVLERVVPKKIGWFRGSCVNDTKIQEVCVCPSHDRYP